MFDWILENVFFENIFRNNYNTENKKKTHFPCFHLQTFENENDRKREHYDNYNNIGF